MDTFKNKIPQTLSLLFFLGCTLFSNVTFGQTFDEVHNIFDTGYSRGTYIQQTNNGEYLLAGTAVHYEGQGDTTAFVRKINALGAEIWTQTFHAGFDNQRPSAKEDSEGNVYLFFNRLATGTWNSNMVLKKMDANGEELWELELGNGSYDNARDLVLTENEDVLVVGSSRTNFNENQIQAYRISSDGTLIWSEVYGTDLELHGSSVVTTLDGNYVIGGWAKAVNNMYLQKIDGDGNVLWYEQLALQGNETYFQVIQADNGDFVVVGKYTGSPNVNKGYCMRTDASGQEIWQSVIDFIPANLSSVHINAEGLIQIVGVQNGQAGMTTLSATGDYLGTSSYDDSVSELNYVVSTNDGGAVAIGSTINQVFVTKTAPGSNSLSGNVFDDADVSCDLGVDENGVVGWYVGATKGNQTWYGETDAMGNYQIGAIPVGDYEVKVFPPAALWDFCEDSYPISYVSTGEAQVLDIPVLNFIDCPFLEVHIANSWGVRICETDRYYVDYCNFGSQVAEDAYIEITLDEYQTFVGSSIPLTNQVDNTLTFDLGDVLIGDCNDFYLDIDLACDTSIIGYTHCVEAHIFPDTICVDTMDWTGASLQLQGICEDGVIEFSTKNVGSAATTPTLNFIVIEDQVIYMEGGVDNLLPDAEEVLTTIPANGKTYRVELEQEPGHPGYSMPTLAIEGCVADSEQPVSTGFVNLFSPDDANNFVDISCVENGYPYDPNDKLAIPYGYGDEHFIRANQQMEYTIRFQNTGTAPAFTVVVRDTLPASLDPATLRPGASSHPYEFAMEGNGIAVFTFENINLPDSTSNFDASQGFVKFDIRQQPDLPIGTLIENNAAIFFDLASPVITPVAFHTIGEDFVIISDVSDEFKGLTIKAFPNPFTELTTIALDGMDLQNAELQLFDAVGKLVKTAQFSNNQVAIQRAELTSGIYFFTIQSEGRFVGNGKLMVQ